MLAAAFASGCVAAAGRCAAMRVAHRACRALWVQPRLLAPAALGCHARALCTSAESAESAAAAAARKAAFEAHEAKTGRVMSTVDRKDAADQAKLLFKKALAMVEASHGRRQMIFPKDILWLAGAPGAPASHRMSFGKTISLRPWLASTIASAFLKSSLAWSAASFRSTVLITRPVLAS